MGEWQHIDRARFQSWPRWVCGEVDRSCGHVCQLPATKLAAWDRTGYIVRVYCDEHAPPEAEPIAVDLPFCTTRLELRILMASMPGIVAHTQQDAIRLAGYALEAVGGMIVGVRTREKSHMQEAEPREPLRIQLAGPAERPRQEFSPAWDGWPDTQTRQPRRKRHA